MPSFDIVSKTDLNEIDNAINGARREIDTRFDFKGSKCTIERKEEAITLFAWAPYMHNPKLRGRLHRIKLPTLVLGGGRDRFTQPAYHDAFAEAIPGARRAIIAGAGHFPHIETPTEFAGDVPAGDPALGVLIESASMSSSSARLSPFLARSAKSSGDTASS